MKKLIPILVIVLVAITTSCATQKANTGHSKEEIMKSDAYALAQVDCKFQLAEMIYLDSISDVPHKLDQMNLKEDLMFLRRKFFTKYQTPATDYEEFQKLVTTATKELTVCKKLEEYKEAKQKREEASKELK